ncbi:unnamed protein product, partial [Trichogramma brassicae]
MLYSIISRHAITSITGYNLYAASWPPRLDGTASNINNRKADKIFSIESYALRAAASVVTQATCTRVSCLFYFIDRYDLRSDHSGQLRLHRVFSLYLARFLSHK